MAVSLWKRQEGKAFINSDERDTDVQVHRGHVLLADLGFGLYLMFKQSMMVLTLNQLPKTKLTNINISSLLYNLPYTVKNITLDQNYNNVKCMTSHTIIFYINCLLSITFN